MSSGACASMVAAMFVHATKGHHTDGWWIAMLPAGALGVVTGAASSVWYSRHFLRSTVREWHRIVRAESSNLTGLKPAMSFVVGHSGGMNNSASGLSSSLPPTYVPTGTNKGAVAAVSAPAISIMSSILAPTSPTVAAGGGVTFGGSVPVKSGARIVPVDATAAPASTSAPATPATTTAMPPLVLVAAAKPQPSIAHDRSASLGSIASAESNLAVPVAFRINPVPPSSPRRKTFAPPGPGTLPHVTESERIMKNLIKETSVDVLNMVTERQPRQKQFVFTSPFHVEVCIRFIRENPTTNQITIGLQLLERGLYEFPHDPMLLLLAATYLSAYFGQDGERAADGLTHQLQSTRTGVPLDVKFLAYSRERALQQQGTDVLDRTELETLHRQVRFHHLRALHAVRDAWEAIRTASSCAQLAQIVSRLAFHRRNAARNYSKLFERNPRDKNTLRSFAQFLTHVEADPFKAAKVLDLAEERAFYFMRDCPGRKILVDRSGILIYSRRRQDPRAYS
ncbi:hypothetical protein BC828DRAFT_254492 [Blastocladiella britannica]|nr:hypothetical protein BC828DRAFT_254492 [Blastocladiella britannica]